MSMYGPPQENPGTGGEPVGTPSPTPSRPRGRGQAVLIAGILAAVAAVSVVTTMIVSSVSADDAAGPVDGRSSMDPADDPFGDLPADDTQRGQVGDCVYHWPVNEDDPNGPQKGKLVKCSSSKANSRIYFFAVGTTDASDCPHDSDDNPVKVYFQIDYNTSDTDDYVICLQEYKK